MADSKDVPNLADLHPALHTLAHALCIYGLTDGFCTPRNCQGCKCWKVARTLINETGCHSMSVTDWVWVIEHQSQIHEENKQP